MSDDKNWWDEFKEDYGIDDDDLDSKGKRIGRIIDEIDRGIVSTSTPKTIYVSELEWEVIRKYAKSNGGIGAACSKIIAYGFARLYNESKSKLRFDYSSIELMSEIRAKSSFIRREYYKLPEFKFSFDEGVQEPVEQKSVRIHDELYNMVSNVASDFGVASYIFIRQCIRSGILALGLVDEPEIIEAYEASEDRFVKELNKTLWMMAKLITLTMDVDSLSGKVKEFILSEFPELVVDESWKKDRWEVRGIDGKLISEIKKIAKRKKMRIGDLLNKWFVECIMREYANHVLGD